MANPVPLQIASPGIGGNHLPFVPRKRQALTRSGGNKGKLLPRIFCQTLPFLLKQRNILPEMLRAVKGRSSKDVISEERVEIQNAQGEKLVGVLHETGSEKLVVLCHGFTASKDCTTIRGLTSTLTKEGISIFRFDFSGNGESGGEFQYGNYKKEANDLHSVVQYLSNEKRPVTTIVGHSKGGDVVLLYASMYHDVPVVINISGRFHLKEGIRERLGVDFLQRIKANGFIDVEDPRGGVMYRVTEESLMERLNTDMHAACLSISGECRVFTIHGSEDEVIPVSDADEFHRFIPNHELQIIQGANHCYTEHLNELAAAVLGII